MQRVILNVRTVDRDFFDMIKRGEKTIETRAATNKFRKIGVGDKLVFKCGKDKLEKEVVKQYWFKSIDDLLKTLNLKDIMPHVQSKDEAVKIWYSFPEYKHKIEKNGLVAFKI